MRLFRRKNSSNSPVFEDEVAASPTNTNDAEKQAPQDAAPEKKSIYKDLGWLDRLLALWILLAIIIGIVLGNFVDGMEEALQRGKFVQVSVPIGKLGILDKLVLRITDVSRGSSGYDVSDLVQGAI